MSALQLPGSFIVSQGNGTYSREQVTLLALNDGVTKYKSGRVLGKITATGKYVTLNPAATDGSQTAAAILIGSAGSNLVDVSTANDVKAAVVVRLSEVKDKMLDWGTLNSGQITTAIAELLALGIVVRSTY